MRNKFATKSAMAALTMALTISTPMIFSTLQQAQAQEFPQSHIDAAKAAIKATGSTNKLNDILPRAAVSLADRLIGNRPDVADQINIMVNEAALELAPRRGDLEKEAAKIYARVFSEEELQNISEFFSTEAGKKFLNELPLVVREVDKAARIWGTGVNRDLNKKVQEKMKAAGL